MNPKRRLEMSNSLLHSTAFLGWFGSIRHDEILREIQSNWGCSHLFLIHPGIYVLQRTYQGRGKCALSCAAASFRQSHFQCDFPKTTLSHRKARRWWSSVAALGGKNNSTQRRKKLMDTTPSINKYRKPNWKRVQIGARDRLLFKTIWEQRFLTRNHVLKHIFGDCPSYGLIRIRKLKKFGYLKTVQTLVGEPESYLLGSLGVEELRKLFPAGIRGWGCVGVQDDIEIASYEHDKMATNVRFLFEDLKLCGEWKSDKILKAGVRGERKTPDGFFTRNGKGIAVEVERREKKASSYRKIIEGYERDQKTHYIFYVCEDLSLMQKIMRIAAKEGSKKLCFVLYKNLMELRAEAQIWNCKGHFKLKEIL